MLGAAGTLTNLGISAAKLPVKLQRRRRSAHPLPGSFTPLAGFDLSGLPVFVMT